MSFAFSSGRSSRAALLFLALLSAFPISAGPRYRLSLEAQPAAVFPYFAKFGTFNIDVFSTGVRTETFWLDGFSRNGSSTITVMNPLGRMFTEVPIGSISALLQKLGSMGAVEQAAAPIAQSTLNGKVRNIAATRHRLTYGQDAYIDYWTTATVPENPQVRRIVRELVTAISPATGKAIADIRGTPIYVELNFRRFHKVPLLRLKALSADATGEQDALSVGSFYVKAPLLDSLWK